MCLSRDAVCLSARFMPPRVSSGVCEAGRVTHATRFCLFGPAFAVRWRNRKRGVEIPAPSPQALHRSSQSSLSKIRRRHPFPTHRDGGLELARLASQGRT